MVGQEDIVEQEEDLSDVAALAAIAMLQSENGEPAGERPYKRNGRGREDRKERSARGDGERRKKGARMEGEGAQRHRADRFEKGGRPRKERDGKGGRHASHDRSARREDGRSRSHRNPVKPQEGHHEGRPPQEE